MRHRLALCAPLVLVFAATAQAELASRLEVPFRVIWYSPSSGGYVSSTFTVLLWNDIAPNTAQNFMQYLQCDAWSLSIMHRSSDLEDGTPFVLQTGGYFATEKADKTLTIYDVQRFSPIQNEFNPQTMSNLRGTIAMARTSDLNSATNQWFVNLSDNLFLDNPSNPYAVFGQIMTTPGNTGMTLLDAVGNLPTYDFSQAGKNPSHYALAELPTVNYQQWQYDQSKPLGLQNLIFIDPNVSQAVWRYVGDMNRDGKITDLDLTMLQAALKDASYAYRELGDVNSDGKVDAADAAALSKLVKPGDMNLDGLINALDIADFVKTLTGQEITNAYKADMNGDQLYNAQDIPIFIRALTAGPGAATASVAAPEPSTAALLLLSISMIFRRGRGRD